VWIGPWFDEDVANFQRGNMAEADALLLGRKTYDGFRAAWPQMTGEGADAMNTMRRYVVTNSADQPEWNASFLSGDPATSVAQLTSSSDDTLLINGSAQLLRSLLDHGLVDELRLMVFRRVGRPRRHRACDLDAETTVGPCWSL
jgi:dihydrofolate reductase